MPNTHEEVNRDLRTPAKPVYVFGKCSRDPYDMGSQRTADAEYLTLVPTRITFWITSIGYRVVDPSLNLLRQGFEGI